MTQLPGSRLTKVRHWLHSRPLPVFLLIAIAAFALPAFVLDFIGGDGTYTWPLIMRTLVKSAITGTVFGFVMKAVFYTSRLGGVRDRR